MDSAQKSIQAHLDPQKYVFSGSSTRQGRNGSPGFVCKWEGLRLKLRTPRAARLRLRGFLHRRCRIFSNVRVFLWLFTVTALIFDFGMFLTLVCFWLCFYLTLKPPLCLSRPSLYFLCSLFSKTHIWSRDDGLVRKIHLVQRYLLTLDFLTLDSFWLLFLLILNILWLWNQFWTNFRVF